MAWESAVPDGAAFAYEVGVEAIREQLRRIEALDSKAGILIAADGVLAGLLFSGDSLIHQIPAFAAASGLIGVLVSLLLALISFTNREYRLAPSFAASVRLMAAPREWMEWRFLGNLEEAFQVNKRRLVRKAGFLTSSMIVLMTTLMVLGGYAVPTVVGGS